MSCRPCSFQWSLFPNTRFALLACHCCKEHTHGSGYVNQHKTVTYTVVSRKCAPPPPFCNFSLSTKRRGGLYAGCDNFSRDYVLPSGHEVIVGWGLGAKRGSSPSARRRDAPDASGRLTSFSVEERGSRALPRSTWRVHR